MIEDFRFNNFVYGVALTLMLGYILFIGRPIFVPVVTSILIVYVIIGVSRLSGFIPVVGKRIPIHVRYILAAIVITALLMELSALFVGNLATIVTRAPEFQENLLNTLQTGATRVGIESTLTWETIRRDALGEINLQRLIRTGFVSIAGLLGASPAFTLRVRELIALISIARPQRSAMRDFSSASTLATPPPTVPSPASATLSEPVMRAPEKAFGQAQALRLQGIS